MDLHQVKRLYYTLSHLKFAQVYHQIKYRLVKPKRPVVSCHGDFVRVGLIDFPEKKKSISINRDRWTFSFLNLEQSFSLNELSWSFGKYGMLWTYNLNYFDWLCQPGISKEQGLETLSHFFSTPAKKNPIILHPYPTSLRIINTAKFISKWDVKEDWLYNEVQSDLKFLSGRLEHHILANHLLENAFALYVGGLITNQKRYIQKGKKLIIKELKEQILDDGMHYERSPMYHMIILERLLDVLNFAKGNKDEFELELMFYAAKMTGLAMNWKDLDRIPLMQDSAYGISLTVSAILDYSKRLLGENFSSKTNELKDSGYRRLNYKNLILFLNMGAIGPSYQPGHAHADELNFELFFKGAPVIVDTGISTYEKNARRQEERSTRSHNCITIEDKNSSDIWSGFRVGRRAQVDFSKEGDFFKTNHNGYKNWSISRTCYSENGGLVVLDEVKTSSSGLKNLSKGRLHFHPDLSLQLENNDCVKVSNGLKIKFSSLIKEVSEICVEEYDYAQGFNYLRKAKVITYPCYDQMKITISETS